MARLRERHGSMYETVRREKETNQSDRGGAPRRAWGRPNETLRSQPRTHRSERRSYEGIDLDRSRGNSYS